MKSKYLCSILFLAVVCGLFFGISMPSEELNDLDKLHMKGKVKSLMEIKYILDDKTGNGNSENITYQKYTLFDMSGYEAENILFKNGDEFLVSRYSFGPGNKQGGMDEYNPDGTLNLQVTFYYDEKGFRTEADYEWADNRKLGEICENTDYYFEIIQNDLFTKVVYKNEYRGYCTEEHYLKADSSLSFKLVSKYDFRGNKLESGYFHGNERLSWMTKYKYDRYDNLVESRVFKSNRIAVLSKYKYEFDAAGNWIERKEEREVFVNILTAGLERANSLTKRIIEYY